MSVTTRLEAAQNELLCPVLTGLLEAGDGTTEAGKALTQAQREAALLVAGLLTAIKVLVMQAGKIVNSMELDDVVE